MPEQNQKSNKSSYVTTQAGDMKVLVWPDLKDRQRVSLMVRPGGSPILGSRENRRRLERVAKKMAKSEVQK